MRSLHFVLVWLALIGLARAGAPSGQAKCQDFMQQYLKERSRALDPAQDPSKMLFFLHVPRTAGKTYYTCFLKSAYPPSKRCSKSYDRLRLNISSSQCTLLSSHDDLSISDYFPPGGAVVTQLRKPLDRVISSYEFAIDVASRHIHQPDEVVFNKTKNGTAFVSTLSVWPWSHLVRWFRQDIRQRMADLKKEADFKGGLKWREYKDPQNRTYWWSAETNKSVWTLPEPEPVLDPFNNPLVTPLHEWIELPIVRDLVHNTAVLQILGLTNYSHWPEHEAGRECMAEDDATREALLGVALRRLGGMAHVGLTERLDQSVLSLAASLGLKMDGPAYKYASAATFTYDHADLDETIPITYNSSIHAANVTVPLREARRRLVFLSARHVKLTEELRHLVPRLAELVEKEDTWLEEQEQAAANSSAAGADADGMEGAEDQEAVGTQPLGKDSVGDKEEPQGASAAKNSSAASDILGAGRPRRAIKSDTRSATKKKSEAPSHPANNSTAAVEGAEQQEQRQPEIDSPFATEIEELDAKVAGMQTEVQRLDWDMYQIQVSGGVRHAEEARGRARQILPDEHFKQAMNLGASYKQCTVSTKRRHTASRRKVFKHVVTPQHESFAFGKEARKAIPQHVVDRILELNRMDTELWNLGDRLLTAKIAEQEAAGVLETFDHLPPQRTRRRGPNHPEGESAEAGTEQDGIAEAGAESDSSAEAAGADLDSSSSGTLADLGIDPEVGIEAYPREEL